MFLVISEDEDPRQFDELPPNLDYDEVKVFTVKKGAFQECEVDYDDGQPVVDMSPVTTVTEDDDPELWADVL